MFSTTEYSLVEHMNPYNQALDPDGPARQYANVAADRQLSPSARRS